MQWNYCTIVIIDEGEWKSVKRLGECLRDLFAVLNVARKCYDGGFKSYAINYDVFFG